MKMSKQREDGGPAFPTEPNTQPGTFKHSGMSLRDYFAAQALVGLIPFIGVWEGGSDKLWDAATAERAYALADAMLAARSTPPENVED